MYYELYSRTGLFHLFLGVGTRDADPAQHPQRHDYQPGLVQRAFDGTAMVVVGGGACPQAWGGSGGAHGGGGGCLWQFESETWAGPYEQAARAVGNPGDPITHP